MHRIDSAGSTAGGQWTAGNPATGTPATELSADWMNAIQEELIAILTEAGVTPTKASNSQVVAAIIAIIDARIAAALGS